MFLLFMNKYFKYLFLKVYSIQIIDNISIDLKNIYISKAYLIMHLLNPTQ